MQSAMFVANLFLLVLLLAHGCSATSLTNSLTGMSAAFNTSNNPSLGISNIKSIASPKSSVKMAVGENPARNAGLNLKNDQKPRPKVRTQAVGHSAFGLGPMLGDSVNEDGANGVPQANYVNSLAKAEIKEFVRQQLAKQEGVVKHLLKDYHTNDVEEKVLEEVAEIMTAFGPYRQKLLLEISPRGNNVLRFAQGLLEFERLRRYLPFVCYTEELKKMGYLSQVFRHFSFGHVKSQFLGLLAISPTENDANFAEKLENVREELGKAESFLDNVLFSHDYDVVMDKVGDDASDAVKLGDKLRREIKVANYVLNIAERLLGEVGKNFIHWEEAANNPPEGAANELHQIKLPLPGQVVANCAKVPGAPGGLYVGSGSRPNRE